MKKRKLILPILAVICFTLPTISSADSLENQKNNCRILKGNEEKTVLFEKNSTTNEESLFEMAKNNEGYLNTEELSDFVGTATIENKDDNKSTVVDVLATSELLEKYKIDDQVYEEIAVTQFIVVENQDLSPLNTNNIVTLAALTDPGSKWDDSISVRISSTNYFTKSGSCVDLTNVSGTWSVSDRTVSIGTKSVYYGQVGQKCSGGNVTNQVSSTLYPGGNSYNYPVPSSWVSINLNDPNANVGHTATAELTRGSSKWKLTYQNTIPRDI